MENTFETSFMPKQPLLKVEGGIRRKEPVNLALVLALVVFFVTTAVAVGLYFYKIEVDGQVLARAVELEKIESSLDINEIGIYKRVNERILLAKSLINGHNTFSSILSFLEKGAAQNVGLTSLSYGQNPKGAVVVTLAGEAPTYEAVYFQIESWRKMRPLVVNVDVNTISLSEESGVVSFISAVTIDPKQTTYVQVLKREREALIADELSPEEPLGMPEGSAVINTPQ